MANRYTNLLPQPPAEDTREAVAALREFAEALKVYVGLDTDVDVSVTVQPLPRPGNVAEVMMSVYVPKTDYANLVLTAICEGQAGFPAVLNPYFAGGSFPKGFPSCQNRADLDGVLEKFAKSSEVTGLLDYMKRHAQKKSS